MVRFGNIVFRSSSSFACLSLVFEYVFVVMTFLNSTSIFVANSTVCANEMPKFGVSTFNMINYCIFFLTQQAGTPVDFMLLKRQVQKYQMPCSFCQTNIC